MGNLLDAAYHEAMPLIKEAAIIIKAGGLVVYPTETLYGLGASATNRIAVLKVFAAKKRPMHMPLSVAVKDIYQAEELVYMNNYAKKLAERFLPGPLTMVMKKKALLPKELTAGEETLGIRIPNHYVALKLIEMAGPITATSANISGMPPPKNTYEAKDQLGDKVNFYLNFGDTKLGDPSTVIDLTKEGEYKILRAGTVTKDAIEKVIG